MNVVNKFLRLLMSMKLMGPLSHSLENLLDMITNGVFLGNVCHTFPTSRKWEAYGGGYQVAGMELACRPNLHPNPLIKFCMSSRTQDSLCVWFGLK